MSAPAIPPVPHKSITPFAVAAAILLGLSILTSVLAHIIEGGPLGPAMIGAAIVPLFVAAVTYGIASLIAKPPTRRRRATIAVIWVMALLLIVNLARTGRGAVPRAPGLLTEAERGDLEVTPTGLRHPILGFSVPHPGAGFVEDTAGQRVMNEKMSASKVPMFGWAFAREDPFGAALVQVATGSRMSESEFREYVGGMRSRMADPSTVRVLADTLIWSGSQREFRLTVEWRENGAFISWRCIPSAAGRARTFIVCAMRTALDTTGLGAFGAGLSVDGT